MAADRLAEALVQAFGSEEDDTEGGDSSPSGDGTASLAAVLESEAGDEDLVPLEDVEAHLELALDRAKRSIGGTRQESITEDRKGRYVRARVAPENSPADVALDATIRAAAPHQLEREGEMAVNLTSADIRAKVRKRKVGASIVFCVDASGSMGADSRMDAARSAVLDLLVDAYQRRDRVGLVSFRGSDAEIVVAPTASVELAQIKMRSMPTGGATPLANGLVRSLEVLSAERTRNSETIPWLVLVTDGRANVGLNGGLGSEDARAMASRLKVEGIQVMVIDTAPSSTASGAREIARAADGEYVRLKTMSGEDLASTVKARVYG